jgi:hypothetical protein
MKEHIESIVDSFVDYAGKTHHFVIVAISEMLPSKDYEGYSINYQVDEYTEGYGMIDIGIVTKVLKLGISMCNPIDTFNKEKGIRKAIARAKASVPALYVKEPGLINTRVVKALLEQEANYLKDNPEKFIDGYADMKARFLTNKEMESLEKDFSDVEKEVVNGMQKNPKFLDRVMKYIHWFNNQSKGCQK